jgi:hypothetical protein
VEFKPKADKKVVAVKKADSVAYYIAAIRFLGQNKQWPYRNKKVAFNHLEQLTLDVLDRDVPEYHYP